MRLCQKHIRSSLAYIKIRSRAFKRVPSQIILRVMTVSLYPSTKSWFLFSKMYLFYVSSFISLAFDLYVFTTECDIRENFDTNECPKIFVSTKLPEWISEYIHINLSDTNECLNKYSYWKFHKYLIIFEYSSRFYTLTHSPTNVRI